MINLQNYLIVEDEPKYNLSIKLVIPSGCNMNCPFCFNNLNKSTALHDVERFKNSFMYSLKKVIDTARQYNPKRSISLDITGSEPTLSKDLFVYVLEQISTIREKINSVVLTTNGVNALELADHMKGIVDIVNISVHHYDIEKRKESFGTSIEDRISYSYYRSLVKKLKEYNIKVSAVSVIYKKLGETFSDFIENFTIWCKSLGFDDLRIRSNFYSKDCFFIDYLNCAKFKGEITIARGLTTKRFTNHGFNITMLMGVETLIGSVVGVESVIDDDGNPYIDYGKQHPFTKEYVKHVYVTVP